MGNISTNMNAIWFFPQDPKWAKMCFLKVILGNSQGCKPTSFLVDNAIHKGHQEGHGTEYSSYNSHLIQLIKISA